MLKKAKKLDKKASDSPLEKQENSTYAILSVGEDDIYYETGELWTSAGSFDLYPTACVVYSPDLTKRKNCEPWSDYLEIVYNKNSDTLSTNIYEYDLYRVRTAQVAGVWSTVKTQSDEEADETYARILNGHYTVPGVWYSITRDTAEEDVYYKVVRTTVNSDGSARIDTGKGMIHSFFDEDYIEFTEIKTCEVGAGGNTAGYNPKASPDEAGFVTDKDRLNDAEKLAEYAISLDKEDVNFYITLARIRKDLDDTDGAIEAADAALTITRTLCTPTICVTFWSTNLPYLKTSRVKKSSSLAAHWNCAT